MCLPYQNAYAELFSGPGTAAWPLHWSPENACSRDARARFDGEPAPDALYYFALVARAHLSLGLKCVDVLARAQPWITLDTFALVAREHFSLGRTCALLKAGLHRMPCTTQHWSPGPTFPWDARA